MTPDAARERQLAYAAQRRIWARAIGRPYSDDADPRPPPGERDGEPDE